MRLASLLARARGRLPLARTLRGAVAAGLVGVARFARFAGVAAVTGVTGLAGVAGVTGCAERPPAVASNTPLPGDATDPRQVLTPAQRDEVIAAMTSAQPDDLPRRRFVEPSRPRWSDVPAAMAAACAANEMAVLSRRDEGDAWTFRIKTVQDRPVSVTVRRIDDHPGYAVDGSVGRFDDRAAFDRLSTSFDDSMEALRKKRSVEDLK